MYSKHKKILCGIFILILISTYILKIDFQPIASDCISIVSFALAIYTICISSLIGSSLLEKLRSTVDIQFKDRTQLGVLKKYINNAMITAIITLIISCLIKLEIETSNKMILELMQKINIQQLFSSICFSFFSLNFTFIIIIFIFIINRQIDS